MKIDLTDLMRRAYLAGFRDSREEYNGETPFDYDRRRIDTELGLSADLAVEEILSSVAVESVVPFWGKIG